MTEPLLRLDGLQKAYPVKRGFLRRTVGHVRAVDGINLELRQARTLGLVGESGSGKSTVARLVCRLVDATAGSVVFDGEDVTQMRGTRLQTMRRDVQMVFQDPYSSLDPMATVGSSIAEPLRTHRDPSNHDRRVDELLETVGLRSAMRLRYPQELSGGQLQRIAIARALAVRPRLLVLDEPVSSLDVSTQADVINLLSELQTEHQVAYLFIAHDLAVVRHVSHHIAVMYLGRVVEFGPSEVVYAHPTHPYTQGLLSAIPVPNPVVQRGRERIRLVGEIPSPLEPPPGCRFHTRCPYVMDQCRTVDPEVFVARDGTQVHCHLHTSGPQLAGQSVLSLVSARESPDAKRDGPTSETSPTESSAAGGTTTHAAENNQSTLPLDVMKERG